MRTVSILLLSVAAACLAVSAFAAPLPTTCAGAVNTIPLVTFDASTTVKIASVTNGTLESVLPSGSSTPLLILHLYGDSYSMGVAYGELLAEQLAIQIPALYSWLENEYHLTPAFINELLDVTRNSTKVFTPSWHFDFMQGVSDGTKGNITYLDFWRVAMIPEAIKATCSIGGMGSSHSNWRSFTTSCFGLGNQWAIPKLSTPCNIPSR